MSNEEKLMIENYKKKRKKVIFIQAIIVGLLSIILVVLFGAYRSVNQVSYINYNETSSINYKVGLVNNDLYEEDELGEDYAYVTSLIKDITADINYKVAVEAENVEYEYTYQIDAIQFGNWFSVLSAFLPETAVFELKKPHRTKNEQLLELWDKVRCMDDTAKEVIERESYSLKVDETLLSSLEPGEAILCLNYERGGYRHLRRRG